MSQAIVEQGFSKMKPILTDKRTRPDHKSSDALMRISSHSEPLTQHQIKVIISKWKNQRVRSTFAESMKISIILRLTIPLSRTSLLVVFLSINVYFL